MEAFEYAIKKDVRNNPIVREVDETRQRELSKSVGIAGFLVLALLFSAWQHFELLRHGYQLEDLQRPDTGPLPSHSNDCPLYARGGAVPHPQRGSRPLP